MQELKEFILACNLTTYYSCVEYAHELIKSCTKPYNPKQPHKIFDKWYKQLVLHEKTDEEKENIEKLKDLLKPNNE